jgi:hypothetical protein
VPFSPTLSLDDLAPHSSISESWETKGKFPPAVKPILSEVAVTAIRLDEYDEYFFNLMPSLFPYNKFTMTVRYPIIPLLSSTHTLFVTHTETYQTYGLC